ncbi:CNGA2, partial [Symbiodinium pilosum]
VRVDRQAKTASAFPERQLKKAANVYGKMVWQEIFNPKKTTMTPVMIADGPSTSPNAQLEEDAKELEAALNVANGGEEA